MLNILERRGTCFNAVCPYHRSNSKQVFDKSTQDSTEFHGCVLLTSYWVECKKHMDYVAGARAEFEVKQAKAKECKNESMCDETK